MTSNQERTASRGRVGSVRRCVAGSATTRSSASAAALLALIFGLSCLSGCGTGDDDKKDTTGGDTAGADGGVDGGVDGGAGDTAIDGSGQTDGVANSDVGATDGAGTGEVLTARSLRFTDNMTAIWGSGPDDIWWVGSGGRVLHYNGSVLTPRKSGTDRDLYGVWGRGPKDVWLVGDRIVLHYDGVKMQDRTPDDIGKVILRGVHAPADASTVMMGGDDGVVYRVLPSNKLMKEQTNFALKIRAIHAINAGNVWAVGDKGQALRLSGGSWASVPLPNANADLHGLTATATGRLLTVGDGGYVAATESKLWVDSLTNDPKSRDLFGIWSMGEKEAWAVGADGALIHHIGSKWNVTDIDGTYMKTGTFRAVWGMAAQGAEAAFAFAVGDKGVGIRFDGATEKWLDYRAETTAHLNNITTLPDGRLIVAGDSGVLLEAKDANAGFVDLGVAVTGTHLRGVADDGAKGFWAVGDNGVTVRITADGDPQVRVAAEAAGQRLSGVALVGKDVVAVGHGGIALRWDGSDWKAEKTGVQFNLTAIATHGGEAWAVGEFGTVIHRDSSGKWNKEASGESFNLHRVAAWDKGVVAVGDNGLVLLRVDGKWSKVFESPGLFLYGVARSADGNIIGVGWKGTLVVGAGGDWKVVESGLPNVLLDVAVSGKDAVAIGHKGGIYQLDAGL